MQLARQQEANGALKPVRSKKHRRSSHLSGKKRSHRQTFGRVVLIESVPPPNLGIEGNGPSNSDPVPRPTVDDNVREASDSVS